MKKRLLILCLACLGMINNGLFAQETSPRKVFTLDEGWECRPITTVNRKAPFTPVTIPHTWNTSYIEGTTLYERKTVVYQRLPDPQRTADRAGGGRAAEHGFPRLPAEAAGGDGGDGWQTSFSLF